MKYLWKSLRVGQYGGVDVVGFQKMPDSSVLAGQTVTCFIDNYENEDLARKEHPDVEGYTNKWLQPICLSHLEEDNE